MDVHGSVLKLAEVWQTEMVAQVGHRKWTRSKLRKAVFDLIAIILCLYWCEHRQLTQPGQLQLIQTSPCAYRDLLRLWQEFSDWTGHSVVRQLDTNLIVEDKLIQIIIGSLYSPEVNQFAALSIEILGQLYEKTLALFDANHWGEPDQFSSSVPIRKSNGIYYTPQPVVQYIVESTMERHFAQRSTFLLPKVLDPTCGSGAFLLTAYQYLLDRQLQNSLADHLFESILQRDPNHQWQLSLGQRKQVLKYIYGVDIHDQSVCVAQLSLYLKLLENVPTPIRSRPLEDCGMNVFCGNALTITEKEVSPQQSDLLDFTFNWQNAFPEILSPERPNPGFDITFGNPPYIDAERMAADLPGWRSYCTDHYQTATGNWDLFCVCMEKSLQLCRAGGLTSLVVPNKLLAAQYAKSVREVFIRSSQILSIRDYSEVTVFPASVYPIVYVAHKVSPTPNFLTIYERMQSFTHIKDRYSINLHHSLDPTQPWLAHVYAQVNLVQRLAQLPLLGAIAQVMGAATVAEAYALVPFIQDNATPHDTDLHLINSGTIDRYRPLWGQKRLRYLGQSYHYPMVSEANLSLLFPKRLRQARHAKILVAGMTQRLECTLDSNGTVLAGKSTSIVLPQLHPTEPIDLRYLLGLLNSRLLSFYVMTQFAGNRLQGGYLRIGPPQLRQIPIAGLSFTLQDQDLQDQNLQDQKRYTQMIDTVNRMLDLQQQTRSESHSVQLEIQLTEKKIDALVYEIYRLTDTEIATVNAFFKDNIGESAR